MNFKEKEKQAFDFIERGMKDEATKLLYELILDSVENNDFAKADSLRRSLISTNSMALTEIINTGEILEKKKSYAIDQNHKNKWRVLYKEFSTEEATEFYYSLKTINLKQGKTIIQQGKLNDKLFFINKGTFKTLCKSKSKEVFLKKSSSGEACGLSTFFFISTATTSVMSDTKANISYINHDALFNITEKLPGFYTKLHELCKKLVRLNSKDIIEKHNVERRKHNRFPFKDTGTMNLLGSDGKPCDPPLSGVFEDLSVGGASFTIKASTKGYARSLLGRKAIIKLPPPRSHTPTENKPETKQGWIVSLNDHLFDNYSISFRFHTPLSRKVLHSFTKSQTS
jgi:Cyclic nucleotide-binding domain